MAHVAWLVDVGYVVKASDGKFRLDYIQAEQLLGERWGSVQGYLFNGVDAGYGIPAGLQRFYDAMGRHGMHVRLQPMDVGPSGLTRQRRVDVDFSAHLVWQASLPDTAVLAITTGDQDFVPAVELVRQAYGKHVLLFTYDAMVHRDLVSAASEWWKFEDHQPRLARG